MAKTKAKVISISGPMDAVHVSGVNATGGRTSTLDSYFTKNLEPDELPSHTFVATGNTEIPQRSDTIASVIRRPSVSIRRSLSRLRTKSVSHFPHTHRDSSPENNHTMPLVRSESTKGPRPLKMQSSMSRLRQRVGLDRDVNQPVQIRRIKTPEPEVAPEPLRRKDSAPLRMKRSLARLTTAPSIYPTDQEPAIPDAPLPSQHQRPDRPISPLQPSRPAPKPPVRPKRADSGTAIDFEDVPVQERPIPFKDILNVTSFEDRMAMYRKTRDYWAHADHGLTEWTGRATGGQIVMVGV